MNDLIQLAMIRATEKFGDATMFNEANFGEALMQLSGSCGTMDGRVVAAILCGRSDCERLSGGSHYRLLLRGSDG